MNVNKKLVAGTIAGVAIFALSACDDGTTKPQKSESSQAAVGIQNLLTSQPVHAYGYSQLRKNLQELEDAQAHGTVTTSFFYNQSVTDPIFSCPSIGAPIASTTELTNPSQMTSQYSGETGAISGVIGQMDPTGVYTGQSTGTYIMCVGQDGSVNPVYWEGFVATVFGPAHWDNNAKKIVIDGPSGSHFTGLNGK